MVRARAERTVVVVDAKEKRRVELAEYKFGLITPAVNGTFPDASMAEYLLSGEYVDVSDEGRITLHLA